MVLLPAKVLAEHFDRQLHRGSVLRFKADDELDDPSVTERFKFAVVLSVNCEDDTIHFAFTTSKTAFYDQNIQFQYLLHRWDAGAYPWVVVPTILNLKQILPILRSKLRDRIIAGDLTFEGDLSPVDVLAVDTILQRSPLLSPKLKKNILP